jgi:2-polyprenyl-6-methoxyphenol hydroxylase-like FAD-dependent oxidoreductase
MSLPPKIAIVGLGPAGLTLARLLHLSCPTISLTLYELDTSPTSRLDQGGTLDLHTESGLAAIRACGLWEEFEKVARYDGEEMIVADWNATILVHVKGSGKNRPEIDRKVLKSLLLESLPEEMVKWGRKLKEVTQEGLLRFEVVGEGRVEVEGPFDLVVGADGAWSKVRRALSEVRPIYSGVSGYEMEIPEPSKTCPHVDKMVGKGSFAGSSASKMCNAQRMGNGSLKVRSWYLCPEGQAHELLEMDGKKKTLENILERYKDWAPEMTEFYRQADLETLHCWTLYELPVGCKWEHQKGFTLIGDAASLATPFSGEGVNKAMVDALELAELIINSQNQGASLTLDHAVLLYEQAMFPRAEKYQGITLFNKEAWFSPAAPVGSMAGLLRKMAGESPSPFVRMLGVPVAVTAYCYLWVRAQIGLVVRRLWRRT